MKRRAFFQQAGLAAAGAAASGMLAAPAIAQENPKITWRMTSSFPKELDTLFGGASDIAERVEAATDGAFTLSVHEAGDIADGFAALDAVKSGKAEAAHTTTYYFAGTDPVFALATAIPFGLNARMQNAWYYQGNGNRLFNDFLVSHGLYALPAGNTGVQMGGWFRKEVSTLDDLRGLKFRIAGLAGKIMERVGVLPQQIAAADIRSAFDKGTIDAAEFVGPYDDAKLGLNKIARYYYYPGWWEGGPVAHALFNRERYRQLPKRYQVILEDACAFANTNMLAKYDLRNPPALKQLVADGVQLRPFSQEIMDGCYQAAMQVYGELTLKNPAFKTIYEDQLAFKKDAYLWAQIGDYTYDTYMMIQQRAGRL